MSKCNSHTLTFLCLLRIISLLKNRAHMRVEVLLRFNNWHFIHWHDIQLSYSRQCINTPYFTHSYRKAYCSLVAKSISAALNLRKGLARRPSYVHHQSSDTRLIFILYTSMLELWFDETDCISIQLIHCKMAIPSFFSMNNLVCPWWTSLNHVFN